MELASLAAVFGFIDLVGEVKQSEGKQAGADRQKYLTDKCCFNKNTNNSNDAKRGIVLREEASDISARPLNG